MGLEIRAGFVLPVLFYHRARWGWVWGQSPGVNVGMVKVASPWGREDAREAHTSRKCTAGPPHGVVEALILLKPGGLVVQVMVHDIWTMRHLAGSCQDEEISGWWELWGTGKVKFSFSAMSLGTT